MFLASAISQPRFAPCTLMSLTICNFFPGLIMLKHILLGSLLMLQFVCVADFHCH